MPLVTGLQVANIYHFKLITSLFLYILCIECDASHTAYKMNSLMISTSTGIQLMFAHATYLLLYQDRMQCHTITVGVKK